MAPKISSPLSVGLIFVLIVLSSFSEMAVAQTFVSTCVRNEGIVKDVNEAESCNECREECRRLCPEGTFLLETVNCVMQPCPVINFVLQIGVCTVGSPSSSSVACSCCCLSKEVFE
ncbi:hypothetical protein MKW98_006173 [Papaver atlanticum]|uniref:4Fe-4S ferredoxin-type domain-containing protein n=1 Tax=Papaver atlanticum TaxID=357466 RepID=A0AAD4TDT8_9MAGN|nr:hypothetical protein MKW98_006173 [Papaver atlanticum]